MGVFGSKEGKPYHAPGKGDGGYLQGCTNEELGKFGDDPLCIEREQCVQFLAERKELVAQRTALAEVQETKAKADRSVLLETKRSELTNNPFDPRTEVSADAQYIAGRIVKNLWIIFVLLPVVLGILFAILTAK